LQLRYSYGVDGYDLVQGGSWDGYVYKRKNTPLIVTCHHVVHATEFLDYRTLAQRLFHRAVVYPGEQRSVAEAKFVIGPSNYTCAEIRRVFKREAKRIYSGVDTQRFRPNLEALVPEESKPGRLKLFWAGNPSRRKGFDLLPAIMAGLEDSAELWIASGLRSAAKVVRTSSNIIPLGRLSRDDYPRILSACDAVLFPSRLEGFGFVVTEAMACAKPCVVSDSSALPEQVITGQGGFVCPLEEVARYQEAILALRDNAQLRRQMGQFNRARVEELFTLDKMGQEYEKLYAEAIKSNAV
jgi:glycosyltransferase involved in cell wall biosynthesis